MADALKPGISVVPEFVDGEQPSAAKLNSLGVQVERAAENAEAAIGDIHGDSWPYLPSTAVNPDTRLTLPWGKSNFVDGSGSPATPAFGGVERSLDIANLARLIGPAANLNARLVAGTTSVTESVPSFKHEFSLRYKPKTTGSVVFDDAVVFANLVGLSELSNPGDYHITFGGKVYCYTQTGFLSTVTYDVDPALWLNGPNYQDARFNVIPDPNQIENGSGGANQADGLQFGPKDAQGRYPITFPLITGAQGTTGYVGAGNYWSTVLDDAQPNFNQTYLLPAVLTANLNPGEGIPDGFLYLRNVTTNETYTAGEYFYNGESAILVGNVDLDTAIAAEHKFAVITVGCDITTSIDDIRIKATQHTHDRSFGEPYIPVDSISGWTAKAGNSGIFVPSSIPGNFAPQYLHRDGYRDTLTDDNANEHNILRGHLWLGADKVSAPYYNASAGADSFRIYFDSEDTFIRKNAGDLIIQNDTGDIWLLADTPSDEIYMRSNARLVTETLVGDIDTISAADVNITAEDIINLTSDTAHILLNTNASGGDIILTTQLTTGSQIELTTWKVQVNSTLTVENQLSANNVVESHEGFIGSPHGPRGANNPAIAPWSKTGTFTNFNQGTTHTIDVSSAPWAASGTDTRFVFGYQMMILADNSEWILPGTMAKRTGGGDWRYTVNWVHAAETFYVNARASSDWDLSNRQYNLIVWYAQP